MSFGTKSLPVFVLNLAKTANTRHCGVEPDLKAHQKENGFQIELI